MAPPTIIDRGGAGAMIVMMKVARSALHISLSLRERVGVRETIMAHATCIFRGGAGAMIVSRFM
jgi:hypothetical protein